MMATLKSARESPQLVFHNLLPSPFSTRVVKDNGTTIEFCSDPTQMDDLTNRLAAMPVQQWDRHIQGTPARQHDTIYLILIGKDPFGQGDAVDHPSGRQIGCWMS